MPNLLIRDMPADVFAQLKHRAAAEHRSMPAEAIHLLKEAIAHDALRQRHQEAMTSIIERSHEKQPTGADSLEMLREDRGR